MIKQSPNLTDVQKLVYGKNALWVYKKNFDLFWSRFWSQRKTSREIFNTRSGKQLE